MIILIDSNAFIADPHCKGIAWRALAHAAPAWGLRITTTEVVVAEVVSKYERLIDDWQKELTKLSKSLSQFGLDQVLAQPQAVIAADKGLYPGVFRKILGSYGIEIIEVPDIPHMDLVQRATGRRRPCDDKGDGYRDTLNWLILLRTAKDNPDEQIAWVSDDTDFMTRDGSGFHADLIDDLTAINASDRAFLYRGLRDLVLTLAAEKSISAGDDLRAIADQLQKNSITGYLAAGIIPTVSNSPLDVYLCGLPLETKSARLLSATDMDDLDLDLKGPISEDQVLAQFTLKATATIEIIDGLTATESDTSRGIGDSPAEATISKALLFRGIITLDSRGKPLTAELSTIEAAEDDPGRKKWDEVLAVSKLVGDYSSVLRGLTLPPDLFRNTIMPTLPPDYFRNTIMPTLPPDLFRNTNLPTLPPDLFRNTIMPTLPPDLFRNIAPNDDEDESSPDDDDDNGESTESGD